MSTDRVYGVGMRGPFAVSSGGKPEREGLAYTPLYCGTVRSVQEGHR